MALIIKCEVCGTPTPAYRIASVIYDGRVAKLCPSCVASHKDRIGVPYSPRADQGAIQPSTSRDVW